MRSSDYYITPYEWKNAPDDKNPKQLNWRAATLHQKSRMRLASRRLPTPGLIY
ncbi:unnamed protein product [Larinioides sclopetarius]|uniref:Uncharacterized protein n=1 Tax=Larinioides sclopetarius TaxID=280406 RepID=A0AAV1ZAS7_9ARAC